MIKHRYSITEKIGKGSFGKVYLALDIETKNDVAIKIEEKSNKLKKEYEIYQALPKIGFAEIIDFIEEKKRNILIMEMLGPSLEDVYDLCDRKFDLKTVLLIANQTIARLKQFHNLGYIHQDIKPHNLLLGLNTRTNVIHLIDFGLSKNYLKDGKHIDFKIHKSLIGTARYVSLNTHLGIEQTRRDDLESLGYVLIYFLKKLPWQNLSIENKQLRYKEIKRQKTMLSIQEICEGLPKEFHDYLFYCRNLTFGEEPDYDYLVNLFRGLYHKKKYYGSEFGWIE